MHLISLVFSRWHPDLGVGTWSSTSMWSRSSTSWQTREGATSSDIFFFLLFHLPVSSFHRPKYYQPFSFVPWPAWLEVRWPTMRATFDAGWISAILAEWCSTIKRVLPLEMLCFLSEMTCWQRMMVTVSLSTECWDLCDGDSSCNKWKRVSVLSYRMSLNRLNVNLETRRCKTRPSSAVISLHHIPLNRLFLDKFSQQFFLQWFHLEAVQAVQTLLVYTAVTSSETIWPFNDLNCCQER